MKIQLNVRLERLIFWLIIAGFAFWAQFCNAESLTLDRYLEQVRGGNKGVQGSLSTAEGLEKRSEEGSLLLAPTLFGSAQFIDDKRPTDNPLFLGTQTKRNVYSLGVSKLTTFGLEGKLSYNLYYTEVIGASPVFLPLNPFHDARPTLELSQSLWRNGFGAMTRADQEMKEAQALSGAYAESFQAKMKLAEAENTYWRLALARETVRVNRESYERAVKIRDWASRRARLQLSDRADLLQAQAALEARELELQSAIDEERSASRAFNSARGMDSDEVQDVLVDLDHKALEQLKPVLQRMEMREDVKAAYEQSRAAQAAADFELSKLSPDLQIFGSYNFNGRRMELNDAFSDSFDASRRTWMVGLRFSAPLDLPTIFQSRAGAKLERIGAQATYERRLFEQEQEWKDLQKKFEESRRRLQLAHSIEHAQKQKLNFEKDRFNRGRTTTYQVLLFEQDYANAQLNRIRVQADLLRLNAQMKTFRGES